MVVSSPGVLGVAVVDAFVNLFYLVISQKDECTPSGMTDTERSSEAKGHKNSAR